MDALQLRTNSTGYTTAYPNIQDGTQVMSGSGLSGGIVVGSHMAAPLSFAINDVEVGSFTAAGTGFTLASPVTTVTLANSGFTTCTALTTTANVLGCTVSDARLKENFRTYGKSLDALFKNIEPKLYSFKKGSQAYDNGRTRFGLIAQDVQKYLPEAVWATGKGGPLQIDHAAVEAALFTKVKALAAANDNLERRLSALERRK